MRMEGYGRSAQPPPEIAQCLCGDGWLQVKCRRCETHASIPLEHIRRPDRPGHAIWKLRSNVVRADVALLSAGWHD
jgi:hypothetical protein